jgi:putative transposase
MLASLVAFFAAFRVAAASRTDLLLEIAALRQQLEVLRRSGAKPRMQRSDRRFWIWLYRNWPKWRKALVIVQPDTVVRWHRHGYRLYWRWRSKGKPGRPRIPKRHIAFIKRISAENPAWGEDRIALEMKLKLGIEHAASTIRRYMVDSGPVPRSTWRSFLTNHAPDIYAFDLTTQVMWDFSVCYILVIQELRTRRIVHVNITRKPSLNWVKQQIRDAFPWDEGPTFLLHDNDGIFGQFGMARPYRCALDAWLDRVMGVCGIPIPYGAPNANAHCERLIGTLKRECLYRFIFHSESHLRRTVHEFRVFYNDARPHQGIQAIPSELDAPRAPPGVCSDDARLVGVPILGV